MELNRSVRLCTFLCFIICSSLMFTVISAAEPDWHENLRKAVEFDNPLYVRDCINAGVDINMKNDSGWTALHVAAANGYLRALSVLLKAGADKEARTNQQDTPLVLAGQYGRDEAVALLAVAGADLTAVGNQNLSTLLWAARNGHRSTTNLIRAHIYLKRSAGAVSDGATQALLTAIDTNDFEAARDAIFSGADTEVRGEDGYTPLLIAVSHGFVQTMSILVKAGANIEAGDKYEFRPLHRASMNGFDLATALLVLAGANSNVRTWDGYTCLLAAEVNHNPSTAALLRAMSVE